MAVRAGKKRTAKTKRSEVPEKLAIKLLQWCDRHCCFCGKPCGVDIEIHHINGDHSDHDEENLAPVCYECHAKLPRYNDKHPRGRKISAAEVRSRREQVYEQHTRRYLEPISIRFYRGEGDRFGIVRTSAANKGSKYPVRLRTKVLAFRGRQSVRVCADENNRSDTSPNFYNGGVLWDLNPGQGTESGHIFLDMSSRWPRGQQVRIEVFLSITDILGRAHVLLPFSYVWANENAALYYDPRVRYSTRRAVGSRLWPTFGGWTPQRGMIHPA